MSRLLHSAICALALLGVSSVQGQAGRWNVVEIADFGSQVDVYVPREAVFEASAMSGRGASAVVFLHAAGRTPETYRGTLKEAADGLGVVLRLTEATTPFGWGFEGDFGLIEASVARVSETFPIDPGKVAIAGHGEGASYAFLLAYLSDLRFSAVLAIGAPFLPIPGLFDPERPPPIHMIFGNEDPLYRSDAGRLREQWSNLGLDWQLEVLPGFGHSTWPQEAILEGFRFLVERSATSASERCATGRTALCLGHGRFRVEVTYSNFANRPGRGKVIAADTPDSGIFWFFDNDNWEIMVKVLDGCALNDAFWVFAAASTDLDYRLTVTDQESGRVMQYRHEPGSAARAITDVDAFPRCSIGT